MPPVTFDEKANAFKIRRIKIGEERKKFLPRIFIDCNGSRDYLSVQEIEDVIINLQNVVAHMRPIAKEAA